MRTETTTRTIYKFGELSESAKAKALEQGAEAAGEDFFTDPVYDDFESICNILGITLKQIPTQLRNGKTVGKPAIYYSGFWSQGDGASFEGTYEYAKRAHRKIRGYAPLDEELHRIADELLALQKGFAYGLVATIEHGRYGGSYVHSGTMVVEVKTKWDSDYHETKWDDVELPGDDMTALMRSLADWLYKTLEKEYDYQTSEESVTENFEANEAEFDEDGNRA